MMMIRLSILALGFLPLTLSAPSTGFFSRLGKRAETAAAPAKSVHVYSLVNSPPVYNTSLGSIRQATKAEFPILDNLSQQLVTLAPGSIREPYWNAKGNQLAYVIEGDVYISILDNENVFASIHISPGQMYYVPSGSLQHIENIGTTTAKVLLCVRDESPEVFSLQAAFGEMTNAVLGNTYSDPASAFAALPRNTKPKYIVQRKGAPTVSTFADFPNPHKFDIEKMQPPVANVNGSAKTARAQFWPILEDMAMYSLDILDTGMREAHWHPNTIEMGYVQKGKARMSILDPNGSVDMYTLQPGDVYFVPASYPHQIENIGTGDIKFLIFFDQPMPEDVGYRTSGTALSKEVIAATFGVDISTLPNFPTTYADPLIVGKINPVDPVAK